MVRSRCRLCYTDFVLDRLDLVNDVCTSYQFNNTIGSRCGSRGGVRHVIILRRYAVHRAKVRSSDYGFWDLRQNDSENTERSSIGQSDHVFPEKKTLSRYSTLRDTFSRSRISTCFCIDTVSFILPLVRVCFIVSPILNPNLSTPSHSRLLLF